MASESVTTQTAAGKPERRAETADTVHGRLLEAVHISGYSLERACSELEWLLDEDRWKTVGGGFSSINEFLATIDFSEFKIAIEQRQKLARRLRGIEASERATARMLGVSHETIRRDLGVTNVTRSIEKPAASAEEEESIVTNVTLENGPPAWFQEPENPAILAKKKSAAEQRKQQRETDVAVQRVAIADGQVVAGNGPYGVIVLDPPWPYGTKYDPAGRRAANPYPEMSLEEIGIDGDEEIVRKAADDCILWLWTTHKFMRSSFDLLDRWGFEEKAIVTWVKDRMGLGSWLRSQSEFCILAVRGSPKVHLTNQTTVIHGPLREHSRKPDEFYRLADSLSPNARCYDRFAREPREGWDVGGNDPAKFGDAA